MAMKPYVSVYFETLRAAGYEMHGAYRNSLEGGRHSPLSTHAEQQYTETRGALNSQDVRNAAQNSRFILDIASKCCTSDIFRNFQWHSVTRFQSDHDALVHVRELFGARNRRPERPPLFVFVFLEDTHAPYEYPRPEFGGEPGAISIRGACTLNWSTSFYLICMSRSVCLQTCRGLSERDSLL